MITINNNAPDFQLPDQTGKSHSLSKLAGKWVVLYFYPKDNTPGCTIEACAFRDSAGDFAKKQIAVLGVSKDSTRSHEKFASKYKLSFPLLSDESSEIIKKYGAWGKKRFMGKEFEGVKRATYVINPQGKVVKVYEKVNPLVHAKEILSDIEKMESANS